MAARGRVLKDPAAAGNWRFRNQLGGSAWVFEGIAPSWQRDCSYVTGRSNSSKQE